MEESDDPGKAFDGVVAMGDDFSSLPPAWRMDLPEEEHHGDMSNVRFAISRITIDGLPIDLPAPGVTAVVGGNNVGKSTLLRQLHAYIGRGLGGSLAGPRVFESAHLAKRGGVGDVLEWLNHYAPYSENTLHGQPGFAGLGGGLVQPNVVRGVWSGQWGEERLGPLAPFFVHLANARDRFQWVQPADRRSDIASSPSHPLHVLEQDEAALDHLIELVQRIFSQPITLDRLSGRLTLRVGSTNMTAPPVDRVTAEYRDALAKLPPLADQGDGLQSVLGLLLPLITTSSPVIMVDEPEAFLHPPQARVLGEVLASLAKERNLQLIVATHDRNFLTGLVANEDADVSVLRLERSGSAVSAKQLVPGDLRVLSQDPALKYTNVLDALFYKAAILAENERDCNFYAASLEALHGTDSSAIAPHDVLFIPTGGKHSMPRMAALLEGVGVRVVACLDLDALSEESLMRGVVQAVNRGAWSALQEKYHAATAEFRQPKIRRKNADVLSAVSGALSTAPEAVYDSDMRARVTAALQVASPWRTLKEMGLVAARADRASMDSLLADLDEAGVVLVEVGELEGFAPGLGVRKGPEWLGAALGQGFARREAAQRHAGRLAKASNVR